MASIYKVFGIEAGKEDFGPIEQTDSAITITEHISQSKIEKDSKNNLSEYAEQGKDLRLLSYQLLVDKFNKKYKSLDESQKNLLKQYINNVSNTNSLKEFIDNEVVKIKKASIPIMITNKMRIELKTLGYSKEEMKKLTPKKANEIIKKGIPKTPSRDRNRNQ